MVKQRHVRKENMYSTVTDAPAPEMFPQDHPEGRSPDRVQPPGPSRGGRAPHSDHAELLWGHLGPMHSLVFASYSQPRQSIKFCHHLCYFGKKSTAPLMGSISGSLQQGWDLPSCSRVAVYHKAGGHRTSAKGRQAGATEPGEPETSRGGQSLRGWATLH